MNQQEEVAVIKKFLEAYITATEATISEKLFSFAPDHLVKELRGRLTNNRIEMTEAGIDEALEGYAQNEISFEEMCDKMAFLNIKSSAKGQVIARQFLFEHDEEIAEYQIENQRTVSDGLREIGIEVPEVSVSGQSEHN